MIKECYFAGGCFWCIASVYRSFEGVRDIISGYSGGDIVSPTYEMVKSQSTGHRETIRIVYDDERISYEKLLEIYLENVDPFDKEGQFIDKGFSYTLAIFFLNEKEEKLAKTHIKSIEESSKKEVYISIEPFKNFYTAEEYHQNFDLKNPLKMEQELIESGRKTILYSNGDLSIRHTKEQDVPSVMEIFKGAREFMKENDNYDQWGDTWPPESLIREDIKKNISYVVIDASGEILASFMLFYGVDPTYDEVRDGAWISNKEYGTIHRLASSFKRKGLFPFVIEFAKQKGLNLRADTHEKNKPMRRSLEKAGFVYCGIISPIEGGDRVAYELIVKK